MPRRTKANAGKPAKSARGEHPRSTPTQGTVRLAPRREASVIRASGPLIIRKRGVCGGVAIIAATRMPVWMLVRARRLGVSDSDLLLDYAQLNKAQLNAAWRYADVNSEEIDFQIAKNKAG